MNDLPTMPIPPHADDVRPQTVLSGSDVVLVSESNRPRLNPLWIVFAAIAALLLVAGVLTSMVYLRPPTDPFVRAAVRFMPFPAAYVDGKPILLRDYLVEHDAIARYLDAGNAAETTDPQTLEQNILDTLINKAVLAQLADSWGVILDRTRVDQVLADAASVDPEAFASNLSEQFGWSVDQFRDRVIASVVLANQLGEHVADDEGLQADAHGRVEDAWTRLESGEAFADVARDVSDDASGSTGGDVGNVPAAQFVGNEFEPILALKPGERSGVISTADAYVIVTLKDRMTDADGEQLALSVIVVSKRTLEDFVDEYLSGVRVRRLLTRA